MLRYIALLSLLSSIFLCAQENDNAVIVFEGEPSGNVCDTVNAITGDFFVIEEDIIVQGVEPIRIPRSYLSSHHSNERTHNGWSSNLTSWLFYHLPFSNGRGTIDFFDQSGVRILYTTKNDDSKEEKALKKKIRKCKKKEIENELRADLYFGKPWHFQIHPLMFESKFTNVGRGLGGKLNLQKTHMQMAQSMDRITYFRGDGTISVYAQFNNGRVYHQLEESTPSGNWIIYERNHEGRITLIKTTNPSKTKCYAWLRIHYIKDGENWNYKYETSDGKTYTYVYEKKAKKDASGFRLSQFIHPELPTEEMLYHTSNRYSEEVINARRFTNGRAVQAGYYNYKDNNLGPKHIVLDKRDSRINRVKGLGATVGHDDAIIPIHTFYYEIGEPNVSNGRTDVYDAYWNLTSYHYNPEMRLYKTEFYQNDGKGQGPHHFEECHWGPKGSHLEGHLLGRSYFGSRGTPFYTHRYHYDDRGNVIGEQLFGTLTGEREIEMKRACDGMPEPSTAEYATKHYQYTNDGRNLLIHMRDENGNATNIF